jgi:hypothetical protein
MPWILGRIRGDLVAVIGGVASVWDSPRPPRVEPVIRDHVAFYPQRVEACYLGGERVAANGGDFYGGWITADVCGPFKGAPGTTHL